MLTDHYFQADEHKKALSLLKRILEQQKDNHKALRQMGEIYLKQGDIQTAEIMIEKAVKKSSDNPKYLYSLVDIKYNTDNMEDAIYLVERILKLRPTNVEYLTAAAMLYEKQGDKINAKKRYFEVLQYDPENRVAKKKLVQYQK
jgi:tetratricopeptide (TPR) repeat protein